MLGGWKKLWIEANLEILSVGLQFFQYLLVTIFFSGASFQVIYLMNGNYGMRIIEGNGITLAVAPRGPGWPDEAVRMMSLHGENCEGVWDPQTEKASYKMTPDKESPLWDVHSKVIYYWTAEMSSDTQAYIWVYHGGIYDKAVDARYEYLSFRAVKDIE